MFCQTLLLDSNDDLPGPHKNIMCFKSREYNRIDSIAWVVSGCEIDFMVISLLVKALISDIIHTTSTACAQDIKDLEKPRPDLIIIDIHTCIEPCTVDLVQHIRHMYNDFELPILLMCSSKYEQDIFDALEQGANDYMYKPIRHHELTFRVASCLKYKKHLQQETILKDILPTSIIDHMIQGQTSMARKHSNLTILFSDICNFTIISSTWDPKDVIQMLHFMFCGFDDICQTFGIYKVETIGDAFMCVCGHDGDVMHASLVMQVAKAMLAFVEHKMIHYAAPIHIRIGIHTGPAFSGVIGKIRPRYCFFGDTVNVASRMESHGFPRSIHLSDATWTQLVREGYPDLCTFRRLDGLEVKGKGSMQTYVHKPYTSL